MEITSFALFGWSMALASILFFIFIYKKVRRTTATGAGLRNNDGSADPDVKIVGQDEKYKRATWSICIGASIIVGPMLGFALGLALKLVIPTYHHIEDTTPNGHYTCYAINGNVGKELFGKYVFNNTDEEYYLCRKNYQYGTPDDKTTYVKAIAPHSATSVPMEIDGWFHPFPTRISYHHGRGPDAVDDHDKNLYLKSATKPFNVLIACTRSLITGLSEKLRLNHHFCLQYPLTPQCDLRQYAVSHP